LIIGGGYGLVLRSERIRESGARTLLPEIPAARSTEDLDVFLKAEIIGDQSKTKSIRDALDQLHYEPVVKNFQFARSINFAGSKRSVKIDLLASPVPAYLAQNVKADNTRIRPRGAYKELHARLTPEAITIEEYLSPVNIGEAENPTMVFIPHPFSYLLLKLFALRDQVDNERKEYGRHHAYDVYATAAMTTEEEWDQAVQLREKYIDVEQVVEARSIVSGLFATIESLGTLRLQEHVLSVGDDLPRRQIADFLDILRELFPAT
jgi:hypothetical protein